MGCTSLVLLLIRHIDFTSHYSSTMAKDLSAKDEKYAEMDDSKRAEKVEKKECKIKKLECKLAEVEQSSEMFIKRKAEEYKAKIATTTAKLTKLMKREEADKNPEAGNEEAES